MNWSTALTVTTISAMLLSSVKDMFDNSREKEALEKENENLRKELEELKKKE